MDRSGHAQKRLVVGRFAFGRRASLDRSRRPSGRQVIQQRACQFFSSMRKVLMRLHLRKFPANGATWPVPSKWQICTTDLTKGLCGIGSNLVAGGCRPMGQAVWASLDMWHPSILPTASAE